MGILDVILGRKEKSSVEFVLANATTQATMKNIALDTCVNYIARTFAKATFIKKDKNQKSVFDEDYYLLNTRPNPNQTAAEFWTQAVSNLIRDSELLIVCYQHSLFIADAFVKNEFLTGDEYSGVSIRYESLSRIFTSNEVVYLRNENQALDNFFDSLWCDYADIMGATIGAQIRTGQIRALWSVPSSKLDEKERKSQKQLRENVINEIRKSPVVLIPKKHEKDYDEISNKQATGKGNNVDEIGKAKKFYIDDVANVLGIPNGLIYGDFADNQKNYEIFIETVIEPIAAKLIDGLNHIVYSQSEIIAGHTIKMLGVRRRDMFELSSSIDKLISSGTFNQDEIREELGRSEIPNGDKYSHTTQQSLILIIASGNPLAFLFS
ncbi:phage portal protein [Lactococcus hodotermopsidis]|uniref:Phage portal protein n=1 Tax=Pseudolactococcus hodotermopsidis TaxID=2709157 RepID=A0A6A0BGX5_9LACT|nr:phage portal protein [Lactococcus hodotermopsidis]GFH43037.1 phage portal protein [Lactococcus hodotermopsidis]